MTRPEWPQPSSEDPELELPDQAVLLIDDQASIASYYARVLSLKGFTAIICGSPQSALAKIKQSSRKPVAIVLDIMMPPGQTYGARETDDGLKTGVLLYRDLRPLCPDVPFFVLTNIGDKDILDNFKNEDNVEVLNKLDWTPRALADYVAGKVGPGPSRADEH
jgi:CheY-like chemotaxis protein